MEDHIVEEVRVIREEHAAQFNYDVDAIFADLKRMELESGRPRVSLALARWSGRSGRWVRIQQSLAGKGPPTLDSLSARDRGTDASDDR